MSPPLPPEPTTGFTALPRRLLDAALCSDMGKRELYTWLLVARLTYGAQGKRWIALRPADLLALGIGSNHARTVLDGMLARRLLVQNGKKPEYRIAAPDIMETRQGVLGERRQRLRRLVLRQIGSSAAAKPFSPFFGNLVSQNGESAPTSAPKTGKETFPKGEENGSQKGNASTVPAWAFSRSHKRFVKKDAAPIDKTKTKINTQDLSPISITADKEDICHP